MVGSHALRGQGSDRPHLLDVSGSPPPPPSFGGESPAREESLLVEQPQRIPGGRIDLFDSGLKDP